MQVCQFASCCNLHGMLISSIKSFMTIIYNSRAVASTDVALHSSSKSLLIVAYVVYNLQQQQPWYNNWWNGNFPTSRWWKMSKIAQRISITIIIIIINTTEMQSLTSVFLYLNHHKRPPQCEMKCIGRATNPIRLLSLSAFIRDVLFGHRQLTTSMDHLTIRLPDRLTDCLTCLHLKCKQGRRGRRRECVLGNCELNCALKSRFGQPSLLWRWSQGSEQKAQDDNILCCVISHNLWAFRYIDKFK